MAYAVYGDEGRQGIDSGTKPTHDYSPFTQRFRCGLNGWYLRF